MADTTSIRTINLGAAQRALAGALAGAGRLGLAVCVCICGREGEQRLAARMDGAPLLSVSMAADKAWTVAAFNGMPTHEWWEIIEREPALVHGITKTDRLIVFGGGVPLVIDGECVGAIGVSGGSAEQDREIAEAAAAHLVAAAGSGGAT